MKNNEKTTFTPAETAKRARDYLDRVADTPLERLRKEPLPTLPTIPFDTTETINTDTLYNKALAITTRAILTNYARSGNAKMRELYFSCIAFAHGFENDEKGGADLVQDVALYLWQYDGHKLTDPTTDGQTDKDGNPITILRGAFRCVGRAIQQQARKEYKQVYITDYEADHGEIAVPQEWYIEDVTEYMEVAAIIEGLKLRDEQKALLGKRLSGMSLSEIAEQQGVTKQAIDNRMAKIRKKYLDVYGEISVPKMQKILA